MIVSYGRLESRAICEVKPCPPARVEPEDGADLDSDPCFISPDKLPPEGRFAECAGLALLKTLSQSVPS